MSIINAVTNVADNFTRIIQLITLLIFAAIALFFIGGYFLADKAIEEVVAESNARSSDIRAAIEESERQRMNRLDGWGADVDNRVDDEEFYDGRRDSDWGN